ncbi:MAG: FkbM family methyltransferase [Halioglobus sp.]
MIENLVSVDDTVFDIDANMGWYSINVAMSKRHCRVYSFEPIPETYSYLQKNFRINAIKNATAYEFGFSDSAGEIEFYYYKEGLINASSRNVSDREDVKVCKCTVKTLEEFSSELGSPVDFIKCDVEGAELLVYKGGMRTILRDRPIVFSEILRKWIAKFNYDPNEIFDLFRSDGYRAFTASGYRLVEFFEMDEHTTETNFFFLHSEKHSRQIQQLCS